MHTKVWLENLKVRDYLEGLVMKVKLFRYYYAGGKLERSNRFYSFLTSSLHGGSGKRHAPAALSPRGNDHRYSLDRRLGGSQSQSRHRR
jgi:hypothetical protein